MSARIKYLIIVLAVIGLGLFVRLKQSWFPDVVNLYLGDTLYAVMMFYIYSFIFPSQSAKYRAYFALVTCYCIEFLQLYSAEWIIMLRATLPGKLILGSGFLWSDLLAYFVGVAVACCIDILWHPNKKISD